MFVGSAKIERGFYGSGIELDASDFDGDWDHVFARQGTKTHVLLTKYKVKDKFGKTMSVKDWVTHVEYNKEWGTKLYREEKLKNLGIC